MLRFYQNSVSTSQIEAKGNITEQNLLLVSCFWQVILTGHFLGYEEEWDPTHLSSIKEYRAIGLQAPAEVASN